ncbi:SRPBCC family protein [Herbiconiux daphne]|uniref:SRPBCC family protein n=1 Tax=Herbiconiux daphne TaxID=2970914 RepID=A0ABT2H2E4_9MICO|nr:SRPBCC family protein [Herbiconiux daphne]MCS5734123.1 SRPBCC family protein [Herbiconiux daphne]
MTASTSSSARTTAPQHPELDLVISRVIAAPREVVWRAWTDPASFEQWWVPAPAACRVVAMELRPGGAFTTEIREPGGEFGAHITGCFLAIDDLERIVWTNALVEGWRPAEEPFLTAEITFRDHPEGTEYAARAMHKSPGDAAQHAELGFFDGWGAVTAQLAALAQGRAQAGAR